FRAVCAALRAASRDCHANNTARQVSMTIRKPWLLLHHATARPSLDCERTPGTHGFAAGVGGVSEAAGAGGRYARSSVRRGGGGGGGGGASGPSAQRQERRECDNEGSDGEVVLTISLDLPGATRCACCRLAARGNFCTRPSFSIARRCVPSTPVCMICASP